MLTPAEAEKLVFDNVPPFPREDCSLLSAAGRVLRMDLRADRDLPPFDRVTIDGYALRAAALGRGIRTFRAEAVQAAGMRAFKLGPEDDACIEIMTGAVLPEGADCVVPYEETTRDGATMTVAETASELPAGNAIHRRGSDHRAGATIVRAGTRLTGAEIGIAAACGYSAVTVAQLPKIAVVSSGDELVDVDSLVAPHQVRRSNDYALRAALVGAGFPHTARFHLRDVPHEIEHLLWHVIAEFDVVVLTGGVSKGKFDHLPAELQRQGVRKIFQGVAQRPGKPLWFGVSARQTPVFALPGNPVSCYTCLHRYVLPALAYASGLAAGPRRVALLEKPVAASEKLTVFLPATLRSGPLGELVATPRATNTSGDFSALAGADGCIELPPGPAQRPAGTPATFHPWA
jgi:molybdopterin molybdotransferase